MRTAFMDSFFISVGFPLVKFRIPPEKYPTCCTSAKASFIAQSSGFSAFQPRGYKNLHKTFHFIPSDSFRKDQISDRFASAKMATSATDSQLQYGRSAKLEKTTIQFIDSCLSTANKCRLADIFNKVVSSAPRGVLEYIGFNPNPPAISKFITDRAHLWRSSGEEVQALPPVFRAAIVDLVASVAKNRNRAPLNAVFQLLSIHHHQALPYLPAPTNGSTLESVKKFILQFPKLFRLVNAEDGNEWTRTTPLGQIVVECVSVVVDGVILLGIVPNAVITATKASTPTSQTSATASTPSSGQARDVSNKITGIGEILRITPAWGFVKSETYGNIFFTARACGGVENMIAMGVRLQQRVYFEAIPNTDKTQVFENVPVRWRGTLLRPLTAAERLADGNLQSDLEVATAIANASVKQLGSAVAAMSGLGQSVSPVSFSGSSPQPKVEEGAMKRLPTGLAEWMRKRQEAAGLNPTSSHSPSPFTDQRQHDVPLASANFDRRSAIEEIEDELADVAGTDFDAQYDNRYEAQAFGAAAFVDNRAQALSDSTLGSVTSAYYEAEDTRRPARQMEEDFGDMAAAAAGDFPECVDVAIQTDVTDEELLLRLLRTAPGLLDLVRVVMR